MTTSSVRITTNPEDVRLDTIVEEIKRGLEEINKQIELQPKTDLPEVRAVVEKLQAKKKQLLAKWLMLATKVHDQIDQIAQRNSDDDYRAIVPLVRELEIWSRDTTLADEEYDVISQLKTITDKSQAVQSDVRIKLVGDREKQAREYLAMADQAIEQPFVRVWPLLRAKLLWHEVARIVDGIEPTPGELESTQKQLDKLNGDIRYEMSTVREEETQRFAEEQETRWRQATKDSDDKVIAETLYELKRILAFSPQVNISQEFLDAYGERAYDVIAVKISESRVRGLLQRILDSGISIPMAWTELQEAKQLARTLNPGLGSEVHSAEASLTAKIVGQLEAHSTNFCSLMQSQAYDDAQLELEQMSKLMPYVDDTANWERRFNELHAKYDARIIAASDTQELKELLDYLNEVNEADDKFDALSMIGYHKNRIPNDLNKMPASIRRDIVAAINRVLNSLPTGNLQGYAEWRKSYLEQIKQTFDKSLQ